MIRLMLFLAAVVATAAAPPPEAAPDLADYIPADKAAAAEVRPATTKAGTGTGFLGVNASADGDKVVVRQVQAGSPAAERVQPGDVLVRVDGVAVKSPAVFRELVQAKTPGDTLKLDLVRGDRPVTAAVTLAATSRPLTLNAGRPGKGGPGPVAFGPPPLWKKPVFRLAVVVIEFADTKANPKFTPAKWEEAFFSTGTYAAGPTGEKVHGSLNDYFREQSFGKFKIEGKAFAPVAVAKKRGEYVEGSGTSNKSAVPSEALAKLAARETKLNLGDFDGVCFVYAGERTGSNRGSLYYPHQGSLSYSGRRVNYVFCPEGGATMEPIGPFALEFAKLLGLPSLAARTEQAGSEGLGRWCLMSDGARGPRPVHLSAWCKEQLGWLAPTVIDPTVKQKLILRPVQTSAKECYKVLVRPDGSEYFLLENRTLTGFDDGLPGKGMLIWRVSGGRPILEESHGVAGPRGPTTRTDLVPYPSRVNDSFTPVTTPSSRSATGGGLPVYLTNIRRLPDGRVTLHVGFEVH